MTAVRRPKGTPTPFGQRLRQLTGPVYAVHDPDTGCRRMRNDTYARMYNRLGVRFTQVRVPYWQVNAHEAGQTKLKVCPRLGSHTLIYFDLDTHDGTGTAQDVAILAQVVRDHLPHMPEFVITDRGGSGWLVVDTAGLLPSEYHRLLKRLEAHLQSVARSFGLSLSEVAVKGKVYVPSFQDGVCSHVKAGDLMKAPPSVEWLEQPAVHAEVFAEARFDPWDVPAPVAGGGDGVGSSASFCSRLVSETMATNIGEVEEFVRVQFPDRPGAVRGRTISDRAFAEILITLSLLKPNADGGNPVVRHRRFYESLTSAGVFVERYRFEKYKAVRDYLSRQGAVVWRDETYTPGSGGLTGQAMKWKLDEALVGRMMAILKGSGEEEEVEVTSITKMKFQNTHRTPKLVLRGQREEETWVWMERKMAEMYDGYPVAA